MPEIATEILAEKVMRQWFQGKLAERLMQATAIAQDRSLLRRGARKMQDGSLGIASVDGDVEDDPVNIHIGDLVVSGNTPTTATAAVESTPQASSGGDWIKKAALAAALVAGGGGAGVGLPWLAGAFDQQPAAAIASDTDTQYELHIGSVK